MGRFFLSLLANPILLEFSTSIQKESKTVIKFVVSCLNISPQTHLCNNNGNSTPLSGQKSPLFKINTKSKEKFSATTQESKTLPLRYESLKIF
jgi:hypothetical protein